MTWMALCAIIAAYIGGYYKKSSHDIDGGLLIHARVDGHENRLLIGAMAYVDGYSLKMPLIPTGSYQAYNVTYHVSLDRERQYAIFAEGSPLAVGFDTPRTLTPGTPVSLCIFENTAEAVINEPLAQEYKDAMRLVVTSMERLLSKKRFYPDLSAAEQTVDEVYREIGSPESISIKVDSHTQTLWSTHGPEWVRYIPAIPILAVWLIGAIFISRNLSRSGVVWTIPSAANDA